ncbi:MAG: sigma-70 family RNA polymerase sigma factor [Dokdonella sp.]
MGADGLPLGVNSGFGHLLDPEVLGRARRGDPLAFESIYRDYGRACYNLALRILGEPAAAEDLVQDVFLRMMATVSKFRGDAPFGAWLKRMTINSTIDVIRRNRRLRAENASEFFDSLAGNEISAESRVDAWTLLMRLAPRERAVVVLHEMEGYTHKELAELFGQSESYSKSILARSLRRLDADESLDPATVENP